MAEYRIIDISGWNENVPYAKLQSYGIKGGIFRVTEKGNIKDSMFEKHYKGFKNIGLSIVGVYKFSYALSVTQIQTEANSVISVLKEHPDFGGVVFLDLEYDKQASLGKVMITQMIQAFKAIIIAHGYKFGIYSNKFWHDNYIDTNVITDDYWVASYPTNDNGTIQERLRPKFDYLKGWQFTESFRIDGVKYDISVFDKTFIDNIVNVSNVNKNNTSNKINIAKQEDVYDINRGTTADDIINIMRGWIGLNAYDGSHMQIVNVYNNYRPLARNYQLTPQDSWCACTVSTAFIKANAVDLIGGTECGVERFIEDCFKPKGIWIENESQNIPQRGDIICFNWDSNQPYSDNTGFADHIGIVESVSNGVIHTIEGNSGNRVQRREYSINDGNIRGYARPHYGSNSSTTASQNTSQNLTPNPIQQQTQEAVQTTVTQSNGTTPSKEKKFDGKVVADVLNIRTWAGTENPKLKSYPQLPYGTMVEVCDTVNDSNGQPWYYIRINNSVYGFASAEYIKKQ